ncbi:MAG: cation diffusion facilitator CzcD-associated flavoprotein CzcO [Flavobacterium sp.]|jgi:cation diffusion facilitator CzcD-associated flavoprotein CzcO
MSISTSKKDALKQKYAEERDKRLRADGNEQYLELKDQLAHYLDDPYVEVKEREPKNDHITVAFIGGGFAGLVTGARLAEQGITDVRILDKGGDFGGTWYWNRYPGAMCDTASFVYMPLLEETGHMPSEKYTHAPEILSHCQRIGLQYKLYEKALFHTQVTHLEWDENNSRWSIQTNRGDNFTAQFVAMGTGPLHIPKLPGIPGIASFKGHSFHTSRWDYDYTGGDPDGAPLENLKDKRVAIIGTGATSVQCIPALAESSKTLYVCQRTPSSVDVRANHNTDPDWFKEMSKPGWQKHWLENFTLNQTGGNATEDLVQDGWTDLSRRVRARINELPLEDRGNPIKMWAAYEDADFEKMEEIRSRVDSVVDDTQTAEDLKAWYGQLCKRPCFHDEYLDAFNNASTKLIDTNGKGVERITETGIVVSGKEYEVDCIIYASGFEVGTSLLRRTGFETVGRGGVTLAEYWENGMKSKHGINVHNFPNAFIVQPTQGANLISNVPHNIVESGQTIALMIKHAIDSNAKTIEVTAEAESDWVDLLLTGAGMMLGSLDCTPGYYNNEGQVSSDASKLNVGYPAGAAAYFQYIDEWRSSGDFEGIEFNP